MRVNCRLNGAQPYAALLGLLVLVSSSPATLAQTCDPSNPSQLTFTQQVAKPEGNLPQYLRGGHVVVAPADGSQSSTAYDPTYTYYYNTPSGVGTQIGYSASGTAPYNSVENAYSLDIDISQDFTKSFGVGTHVMLYDSNRCQGVDNLNSPPYVIGHTTVVVNDAAGHPLAGAQVNFLQQANNALYNTATTPASGTVTFGADPSLMTDAGYPGGLARLNYVVRASASGYAPSLDAVNTGLSWPGQLVTITLSSSSSAPVVTSAPTSGGTGTGGDGQTCGVAFDYVPAASDAGGGSGVANWSDNSFPSTVQPAYLHSSSFQYGITVATAGEYVVKADLATAPNMGDSQVTINGVAGPVLHDNTSAAGANAGAIVWTGVLPAGPAVIHFAMINGSYSVAKSFHFLPASGCGPAATGGTGTGFPTDFFAQLKQTLIDFFTLQQADLDSIHGLYDEFMNYGPFSIPAQVKREFNNAFPPAPGPTDYDPSYWVIPFRFDPSTIPIDAGPAGYSPTSAPPPADLNRNLFASMFPSSIDVSPAQTYILAGRKVALIAFWVLIALALIRRFTPELRV